MKLLKEILLYIWQLPQNLAGLLMILILTPFMNVDNGYRGDTDVYVSSKMKGGVSLGRYIFLSGTYGYYDRCKDTWDHEYGHTRQSMILGPLYLIVIGIPSICWAGLYGTKLFPYENNGYYKFYTEKWADKLGGVARK